MNAFVLYPMAAAVLLATMTVLQGAEDLNWGAKPMGWASVDGVTTGGADGPSVTALHEASLVQHAGTDGPLVIQVSGTIRLSKPVRVGSDKTIVGIGSDARLIGGGLRIAKVKNVLIQNLAISEASDAVDIEASHHIWVDHCDLSRCKDGLLDIKRGSDLITVSWNHFHHHHKTCLLGHSDKEDIGRLDRGRLRVSYHHNFFDGTMTRHPRVRFADGVHVFNNYFRSNEYGVASVMDAGVLVESNYFEDVEQPTLTAYGESPHPGRLVERNNTLVRSGTPQARGTVNEPSKAYSYRLDNSTEVATMVKNGAGVQRTTAPAAANSTRSGLDLNERVDREIAVGSGRKTVIEPVNRLARFSPDSLYQTPGTAVA